MIIKIISKLNTREVNYLFKFKLSLSKPANDLHEYNGYTYTVTRALKANYIGSE